MAKNNNYIKTQQRLRKRREWLLSPDLKWLNQRDAIEANKLRDSLIREVSLKVNSSFFAKKLHLGPLSPGCTRCVKGTWTCAFFTQQCNAHCFYCPNDPAFNKRNFLIADNLVFKKDAGFVNYLKKLDFNGVSFSGGECLIQFRRLLGLLSTIRSHFGEKMHLWIYTNGRLVDKSKLKKLHKAGLNEIRFNISTDQYNLTAVRLAVGIIPTVTVEIPMIPEDYDTLYRCLPQLKDAGVRHLNIHQIYATRFNYKNLSNRGYTLLRKAGPMPPTLESELCALKLLNDAPFQKLGLPINYCTWEYRNRVTRWSGQLRAARLIKNTYEDITPAGYLREISVRCSNEAHNQIREILEGKEMDKSLWEIDKFSNEIYIHSELLKYINSNRLRFTLRYFRCQLQAEPEGILGYRTLVYEQRGLTASALKCLLKTNGESSPLKAAANFEHIRKGFPRIY